jgi:signal transduction histidine kinase
MKLGDLFPSQMAQELQHWIETRPAGENLFSFDRETELRTRDGELVPVRITICLLEGDGNPFGIVCFIKDEREIERLKDHLRESERMAVIGEIASALSHSIRNILQGVKGGAHVVAAGQTQERWAMVAKGQEMMERNVRRMEEFMEELLRAVEQRQLEVSACEIHQLLEEAVALVHHKEASPPLLWEKRWYRFPLWVKVDPDAVRHCFFNILANAVDACRAVTERSGRIRVETFLRSDCGVRVVFQDNGVGMDEQTSARLFGEIFTTKGSSGLGLGLFVTGRLFQRCGATTQVESTPGEGTRITVDFPRVLEEPCEAEASLS